MKRGFTLIELMIVVAIIAIIAAIAIPSLMRARQSANESNASAALKSMSGHQAVWRRADSDGNGVQDYWCGDLKAFYAMEDGEGTQLKFIDVAYAKADFLPSPFAAIIYGLTYPNGMVGGVGGTVAKAGYYYLRMIIDETGNVYSTDTSPADGMFNPFNSKSDWAVCAFPARYNKDGIRIFIANAAGVVYGVDNRKSPAEHYGMPALVWPAADPTAVMGAAGRLWSVVQE